MNRLRGAAMVVLVGTVSAFAAEPAAPSVAAGKALRVTPIVQAYRRCSPAVVNISTQTVVDSSGVFGQDDPFEAWGPRLGRQVPAVSLGSGFLVHPDGYIVTNCHVVARAQKITVTLTDQSSFDVGIVAANPEHDLAVLKVLEPKGRKFDFLPLGRSDDIMIGETVIAIGNPLGLQNTLTTGVVSATDRKLDFRSGVSYTGIIQVDAPINPGNSGGPLLNINGELIGINTAIRADAQGIGFAIPVDALARDFPQLLDYERLNRVIFGLRVAQTNAEEGCRIEVAGVDENSPAAKAGFRTGDRLVTLNGQKLAQITDYQIAMLAAASARKVALSCLREGKTLDLSATLEERPKPNAAGLAKSHFGLKLAELTAEQARAMRLHVESGLVVMSVEADSPAEKLGLRRGDVVFQVGRFYVGDLDKLGAILEDLQAGASLQIGIIRGTTRAWGPITARQAEPPPKKIPA
jgi:serine protease Do